MFSSRKAKQSPRFARLARRRPGSVLILVVALLVLLALIGTAWMSTTRTDLYASNQHAYNTQVDLLVDSTVNMVNASIVGDLYENGKLRPSTGAAGSPKPNGINLPLPPARVGVNPPPAEHAPNQSAADFENYDSPLRDAFLRDRIPGREQLLFPFWRAITDSPLGNGYEAPYARNVGNRTQPPRRNNGNSDYPLGGPYRHERRVYLHPTYIDVPTASGISKRYPALQELPLNDSTLDNIYGAGNIFAAADTDGDGVADAALWRLPIGQINGVTYYAAASVVDNNSAVNAAVAWEPNPASSPLPGQFFPSNISLRDMLFLDTRNREMNALNVFRFGGTGNLAATNTEAWADPLPNGNGRPYKRQDFQFLAANGRSYDAFWHQLGARIDNPGYKNESSVYRALSIGDSMSLAQRFMLANPSSSLSLLEDRLNTELSFNGSTKNGAPVIYTSPVALDELAIRDWYADTFDFANPDRFMPQRAVMVARNAVSNFVPSKLIAVGPYANIKVKPGTTQAEAYQFGDWVTVNTPNGPRAYVCVRAHGQGASLPLIGQAVPPDNVNPIRTSYTWAAMDWATHPTKVSVNTGSFEQLWVAFWSVMAQRRPDQQFATTPFRDKPNTYFEDKTQASIPLDAPIRDRMFRSPIRDPRAQHPNLTPIAVGGTNAPSTLTPYQTLLLRSALAAVNALDLRDSDDDVTSRRVSLFDPNHPENGNYEAVVYGTEKQPYITKVFAENDKGFIGIELYNPYPTPISMYHWRLAAIDRHTATVQTQSLRLKPLDTDVANWDKLPTNFTTPDPSKAPVIPPNGFLVIMNQEGNLPAAVVPPQPAINKTIVPDLTTFGYDHEIVLLRPRRADGVLSQNGSVATNVRYEPNQFNETNLNRLQDLVPVDSYDFTNLPGPGGASPTEWYFAKLRSDWKWVYPGDYNAAGVARLSATNVTPAGTNPAGTIVFGAPIVAGANPFTTGIGNTPSPGLHGAYVPLPIQLNNYDFAGPNKALLPTNNRFPFGGFARNGDILEVPFIGAYRIQRSNEYGQEPIVELNAVTMDSIYAEDGDPTDDAPDALGESPEQVGRFCPVDARHLNATNGFDDYLYTDERSDLYRRFGENRYSPGAFRYSWVKDLFDYVTVESPQNDYLPNVDATPLQLEALDPPTARYPGQSPLPGAVANANPGQANFGREETVGVEGLININTAPWWVLAKVPMLNAMDNAVQVQANQALARLIVRYRDGYRRFSPMAGIGADNPGPREPMQPFRSLFDLNRLIRPVIANDHSEANDRDAMMLTLLGITTNTPGNADGDITPLGGTDNVGVADFERRFLFMNRVSNLLTTRSDSFTVYIQVQGWKDVGGDFPELVVQRRVSYIADRTAVTPTNPNLRTTLIPSSN